MISINLLMISKFVVFYYVNIGKVFIWGIEVEVVYDFDYVFVNVVWSMMMGIDLVMYKVLIMIFVNSISVIFGGCVLDKNLEFGWNVFFVVFINIGVMMGLFQVYQLYGVFVVWKFDEGMLKGLELCVGIDNLFNQFYQNNFLGDVGKG